MRVRYRLLDSPRGDLVLPSLASEDIAAYHIVDILGHPQFFLAELHVTPEAYYRFSDDAVQRSIHRSSQMVRNGCTMDAPPAILVEDVGCRLCGVSLLF